MYIFRIATLSDASEIFALYVRRIKWMDENGLEGWNTTNYLERYPEEYYGRQIAEGNMFVIEDSDSHEILGAVAIYSEDERWDGLENAPAFYVHNLVSMPGFHGLGAQILYMVEGYARWCGKSVVRLDCAQGNRKLNEFYGSRGYELRGECQDGPYIGYLREKTL